MQAPPPVLDAIISELPVGWEQAPGALAVERVWRVVEPAGEPAVALVDGDPFSIAPTALDLTRAVSSDLELWVAEHADNLIFVHAGVVVFDGRAIVLPGPSRSGKSTLVAALVQAGGTYYSDEYAPIDPAGLVHPYPRPLRLRFPAKPTGMARPPRHTSHSPVPVDLVAALDYHPTSAPGLTSVTPGRALLRLLGNTVAASGRTAEALHALTMAIRFARAVQGTRREAEDVIPFLRPSHAANQRRSAS